VWTESVPGLASNWYFILPNVYGETNEGTRFSGLAIQLTHGVAIQWDGRILRHCTSILHNDGVGSPSTIDKPLVPPENQVYGMFSAAKTKLVDFARTTFAKSTADQMRLKDLARLFNENSVSSPLTTSRSSISTCCVGNDGGNVNSITGPLSDNISQTLVDNKPSSTVLDSIRIPRRKKQHAVVGSRGALILEECIKANT
jgi:hypothetical protein